MDHLETPQTPLHGPVRVKCFCTREYRLGSFFTYLEDQGRSWEELVGYEGTNLPKEERNTIIQTLFYFGLLSEITGRQVSLDSFISTRYTGADGQQFITSAGLPALTQQWIQSVKEQDPEEYDTARERAWSYLAVMSKYFLDMGSLRAGIIARDGPNGDPKFADELLLLSCEVLYIHLSKAIQYAYEPPIDPEIARYMDEHNISLPQDTQPGRALSHPFNSTYLVNRMIRDGWCPSEVDRLFWNLLPPERYFVSLIDRPKNHLSHKRCEKSHCIHWRVSEETYVTRHVCSNSDCQNIAIPDGELHNILANDKIPLILTDELNEVGNSLPSVKLMPSGPDVKYVAISHVWADGLGNPSANEIPKCQFTRLSSLVKAATKKESDTFWFDTLCFPLTPKDAYDAALKGMRRTYEEADLVLVLDSYLLGQDYEGLTSKEIRLRILCSSWSCRLWTYQENRLAKRIMFQFKDGAVEIPFGWLDFTDSYETEGLRGGQGYIRRWNQPELYNRRRKLHVAQAQLDIAFRATSEPTDEALCVANLIAMDPSVVVDVAPEDRMRAFWKNLDPQQSALALFWDCRRMEEVGLRWAPATLMTRKFRSVTSVFSATTRFVLHSNPLRMEVTVPLRVELTDKGICVRLPAVVLTDIRRPVESQFFYKGEDEGEEEGEEGGGQWYQVDAVTDTSGENVKGSLCLPPNGTALPLPTKLVIIFEEGPGYWSREHRPVQEAILCSVESSPDSSSNDNDNDNNDDDDDDPHSDNTHHVKLWCTIRVTKVNRPPILDMVEPLEPLWDAFFTQERNAGRSELTRWSAFPPWGRIRDRGEPYKSVGVKGPDEIPLCMVGVADPDEDGVVTAIPPQRLLTAGRARDGCVWCVD